MNTEPAKRKEIQVKNYHSGARGRIKSVEGEYYGFEMEVDFPGKSMRARAAVVPNGNVPRSRYQLDAERDGSLNESGVELITKRPLKVTEIRGKWMQSTLARMKDEMGVQPGKQPNNYGLHVNVNLQGMSLEETIAFLATLNFAMSTEKVQRTIMERGNTYQGLEQNITRMINCATGARNQSTYATNKYSAIANYGYGQTMQDMILPKTRSNYAGIRLAKAPIAEVRGFHMNTDLEQFKIKADLVQKARRFANKNTKEMILLLADSVETNVNKICVLGNDGKEELLNRILDTPLTQELTTVQVELPEHAKNMINYVKAIFDQGYMPRLDENKVLRARK